MNNNHYSNYLFILYEAMFYIFCSIFFVSNKITIYEVNNYNFQNTQFLYEKKCILKVKKINFYNK